MKNLSACNSRRHEAHGQKVAVTYFNDFQHTKKIGARVNAECVVEGLKQLRDCPIAGFLLPSVKP